MVVFIWFVWKSDQIIFLGKDFKNYSKIAFFGRIPSEFILVSEFEREYFVSDEIS